MIEIKEKETGRVICCLEVESLAGADLAGRDLTRADFHGADLRGANLEGARVHGADFAGANLEGARMAGLHYSRGVLDIPSPARGGDILAVLIGLFAASMVGLVGPLAWYRGMPHDPAAIAILLPSCAGACVAAFLGTHLYGRYRMSETVNLRGACLRGADLTDAHLCRADLESADLRNATLNGARLSGANLRGADLEGAQLIGTSLGRWVNPRDAKVTREPPVYPAADLRGAKLRGVNLSRANLEGTDLRGADLRGIDLSRASLYCTNLRGADLRGAMLTGASLRQADLREADLTGADLQNDGVHLTNLSWTRLQGARYDVTTSWPRFFELQKRGLSTPEEVTPAVPPRGSGEEASPAAMEGEADEDRSRRHASPVGTGEETGVCTHRQRRDLRP
jgi:uncharacterized protein YjbI with pentapeptide repeats